MLTSAWNGLGFVYDCFNNSESTLYLRDNNFIHGGTFRFKTLQDVFIHLELCYTLHERLFSKIHNRGTLKRQFIQKFKFCYYLLPVMSFQTSMTTSVIFWRILLSKWFWFLNNFHSLDKKCICLFLWFAEERESCRFETMWCWVNDVRIKIFGWTIPLTLLMSEENSFKKREFYYILDDYETIYGGYENSTVLNCA